MPKKLSKTEDTEEWKAPLTSHVLDDGLPWRVDNPRPCLASAQ